MEEQVGDISVQELQLAARNHGMPQEALAYDVTPIGLHYLLIHYDVPVVDPGTWRLYVDGAVDRPLGLSLAELRSAPRVTAPVTMECAGNGRALLEPRAISQPWLLDAVGTAEWTGTPLGPLLEQAGIRPGAVEVLFTGLDRGIEGGEEQTYARSLPLEEVRNGELILAYEANGVPLPPQHGFPIRLIVPGWYGMTSVKWLSRITALDAPHDGYQNRQSYRFRSEEEDEGTPVTRIEPRSLIVPPGIPDFLSRVRIVPPGDVVLHGRAWSGWGSIMRVEVSTDDAATWRDAAIAEAASPRAWVGWSFPWHAAEGEHMLSSRATDETGRTQPTDAEWNLGGYANNSVQRMPVTVSRDVAG
ncbi:MAG: sulfite oxidase [Actinomycetota bacterium]|nr:sulfite oxidase [Actinomycetota bacterium]